MTSTSQVVIWLVILGALAFLLYLFSPILLPFVAGFAIAYFVDPLVSRLGGFGIGRSVGSLVVLSTFFAALIGAILFVAPLIEAQVAGLAARAPEILRSLESAIRDASMRLSAELAPQDMERIRTALGNVSGDALQFAGRLASDLIGGGVAFLNLLSLIFITPMVAFFILRDWPAILNRLDSWLPREHRDTVRRLAGEADNMVAGFVRGMGITCITLAIFYAVSLSLVGLEFALLIGITAGLISFVPFVGAAVGFAASFGMALFQFSDWIPIALTAGVFALGQFLEGNLLTPYLVGSRIRLHPVWVIFSVLAGGLLMGFVGVLLAVPVAAVIGVLVRFALESYLHGRLYSGASEDGPPHDGVNGETGNGTPGPASGEGGKASR